MTTASDVAAWMFKTMKDAGRLDREQAVAGIRDAFGDGFLYETANGNVAISKEVLGAFKELRGHVWVWEAAETAWMKHVALRDMAQGETRT